MAEIHEVGLRAASSEVALGRAVDRILDHCPECGARQLIEIATDGCGRLIELPEPCACGAETARRRPLRKPVVVPALRERQSPIFRASRGKVTPVAATAAVGSTRPTSENDDLRDAHLARTSWEARKRLEEALRGRIAQGLPMW